MNTRQTLILVALSLFATSAMSADLSALKKAQETYAAKGKELLAMINSGKVDETKAAVLVDAMAKEAVIGANEYAKAIPKAEKLIKMAVDAVPDMKKAANDPGKGFEELEKNYHDGAKLAVSGIDLKKEENEKYTDPVHTLVHPFLTLNCIKKKDLGKAKEELAEGLEQMEALVQQVSK